MADRDGNKGLLKTLQAAMSRLWTVTSRPDVGRSTVYEGTADPRAVARRRARNKAAARSRRVNRIRSKR